MASPSDPLTDIEIARLAVERGWLTEEALSACVAERRAQLGDGLAISLRELIVDGGHLDAARWDGLQVGTEESDQVPKLRETRADDTGEADAEPADPEQVLGGYRIVSELGRGAMGVVYEAIQEGLGRRVALKVLPEVSALRGVARERFAREAKSMASLKHPGIVPIYDIGEDRGVHFFAMELLDGHSLRDVLDERGPFDPREAAGIIRQAAEAVAYAHESGVVHRDVKPDNILLRGDGAALLTDFGLARHVTDQSLTRDGMIVGTPLYMAPEQARGDGAPLDGRSDVYGLGITLYEMLAGNVPFETARDTGALLDKVVSEPPPPLHKARAGLPQPLVDIVEVALAKDPAERFQSAQELADDLNRFLSGEPILARPPSALTRAFRRARRSKRQLFALGTVCGLLIVAGGALRALSLRWQADALVLEAMSLAQAGQLDAAGDRLDEALVVQPGMPEALFRQGELHLRAGGAPAEALISFNAALRRDPHHVDALLARAQLLLDEGHPADALADCETARANATTGDPRPGLLGGLALRALDRPGEARDWLRHGLTLSRDARESRGALYAQAVMTLGALELERGNPAGSLPELEEAVRLLPSDPAPRLLLTQALMEAGMVEGAVDAASAALVRDPSNLKARVLRAQANRHLGRYLETARDLADAIDRPSARMLRGLVRFEAMDIELSLRPAHAFDERGAADDLQAVEADLLLSDSERALAQLALGWLSLSRDGRRSPALRAFDRACELAPGSVFAHLSRGLLLVRWGKLDQAEEALRVALPLPGGGYAARVGLAQVAAQRGQLDEARRLLDEAIALEPERTTAYGERYRLRYRQGDPDCRDDWRLGLTTEARTRTRELRLHHGADPFVLSEAAAEAGFEEFAKTLGAAQTERRLERATSWLRRALLFDPGNLSAAARHASTVYLTGRVGEAVEAYERARSVDPSLLDAELMAAVVERDHGGEDGPQRAERRLRAALKEAPPGPDLQGRLRFELARTLIAQGELEDALQQLEEALAFTPKRFCVASLRVRLLALLGRPGLEEARELASRLFHSGKRDRIRGALYTYAGERQRRADIFPLAEKFLQRAIEADHRNVEAWRMIARIQLRGTPEQIPQGFVAAFVAAELDPRAIARFLDLESRLSRLRPILQHVQGRIEELLDEAPELPAAPFVKGYLEFHDADYEEAEGWFSIAYQRSMQRSYFALTYRGAARLRQGRLDACEADLKGANALFPNGPLVAFWLASLAAARGDDERVFAILRAQLRAGQFFPQQVRDSEELRRLLRDPRMVALLQGDAGQ